MKTLKQKIMFKTSEVANNLFRGQNYTFLEIGAGAHNPIIESGIANYYMNVDQSAAYTHYQTEQERLCGRYAKVDFIAKGDAIPVFDKTFDVVMSSHVLEHFYDPIAALKEWERIARRYVLIIVPSQGNPVDGDTPVTTIEELMNRHSQTKPVEATIDKHWTVFDTVLLTEACALAGLRITSVTNPDDKVGNGFMIIARTITNC